MEEREGVEDKGDKAEGRGGKKVGGREKGIWEKGWREGGRGGRDRGRSKNIIGFYCLNLYCSNSLAALQYFF